MAGNADSLVAVLVAQPVVDIKDVIVILVVVSVVVDGLAGLGENPSGIVRRFISELGVADMIGLDDVGGELPQGLDALAISHAREERRKKEKKKKEKKKGTHRQHDAVRVDPSGGGLVVYIRSEITTVANSPEARGPTTVLRSIDDHGRVLVKVVYRAL